MEIKATLNKPYTDNERMDFVVQQNHKLGYEIRETNLALEAWGADSEELLEQAKQAKYNENDTKASEFRHSQTFTLIIQKQECLFDTTGQTQLDLNTATNYCIATGGTYDDWTTNNGVKLNLTLEDIALIGSEFKAKANVYDKWNEYKQAIDEAETIEEVEAIEIIYEDEEEQNEV